MLSAGVAVTYGAVRVVGSASAVLVLVGAAMFFALGLEPAVSELVNRRLPRWAAVTVVVVLVFGVLVAAVAAAIPPLVDEARHFIEQAPHYLREAQNHSTLIGRINERFHLQQRITDMVHSSGTPALGNVVNRPEFDAGFIVETSPAGTPGVERNRRSRTRRAGRNRAGCAACGRSTSRPTSGICALRFGVPDPTC
jgi:AI-2E family transporter